MKWEPLLVIGGFAVVFVVILILTSRAAKKQRERLAAAVAGRGGQINFDLSDDDAARALTLFPKLSELDRPLNCVKWVAALSVNGVPVTVLQHRYSTGSGKNRRTHVHTGVAVEASRRWPLLSLTREHALHRIADVMGFKDIRLEDEAFNKAWRVRSEDESFAILALTPEVQAWLMGTLGTKRTHWEWSIGRGSVCVMTSARFDVEELEWAVEKPGELLRRLPAEMAEL